jgi:hypothetical protein
MLNIRAPQVFIATPSYDGKVTAEFATSLSTTQCALALRGISSAWKYLAHESLLPRARNILAALFLAEPDFTHVLWVDADQEWQPDVVLRMLELDLPFQCAWCPTRREPRRAILAIGGFAMVKREVYVAMIEAGVVRKIGAMMEPTPYENAPAEFTDALHEFYSLGFSPNGSGAYVGEDQSFVFRWQSIGGRVHADPSLLVGHAGHHLDHVGDAALQRYGVEAEAA